MLVKPNTIKNMQDKLECISEKLDDEFKNDFQEMNNILDDIRTEMNNYRNCFEKME